MTAMEILFDGGAGGGGGVVAADARSALCSFHARDQRCVDPGVFSAIVGDVVPVVLFPQQREHFSPDHGVDDRAAAAGAFAQVDPGLVDACPPECVTGWLVAAAGMLHLCRIGCGYRVFRFCRGFRIGQYGRQC